MRKYKLGLISLILMLSSVQAFAQDALPTDAPTLSFTKVLIVLIILVGVVFIARALSPNPKKSASGVKTTPEIKTAPQVKTTPAAAPRVEAVKTVTEKTGLKGEELAAIGMALQLHFNNMHDVESEVITIDIPSAYYSPWAQKHLTMKRVVRK